MKKIKYLISALLCLALASSAAYAHPSYWIPTQENAIDNSLRKIKPQAYQLYTLDIDNLRQQINSQVQAQGAAYIVLPNASGTWDNYKVVESPCMEPALAAAFSQIQTFTIIHSSNPWITGKIDFTDFGFHGIIYGDETMLIDPVHYQGGEIYQVYNKNDYHKATGTLSCAFDGHKKDLPEINLEGDPVLLRAHGNVRKNYRLALACTGEYAQAVTGMSSPTKSAVLSKMVTTINRVNGIYERELSVHLTIIDNNTNIIYTNPSTDPFNNWDAYDLIDQNQSNTNAVIGAGNYDIGHVFSTGGGGLATLASVCIHGEKAEGVTGSSTPMGDAYDVDYVAHEVGHQLGANHTFNSCDGNEDMDAAFEPGSGSTIMAYAGICDDRDNIQGNSDDYFHPYSLNEISRYISGVSWGGVGGGCGTTTTGPTNITVASIASSHTIPASTAFEVEAPAVSWAAGPLTYGWEQWNLGQIGRRENIGQTASLAPVFRSRRPVNNRVRSFPHADSVLKNKYNFVGERTPTVSRNVKTKLVVKGLSSDGYGSFKLADQVVDVNVYNTGAPFQVTNPDNSSVSWLTNTMQTVTWNVAGTNASPINASHVHIYLSLDGGKTYPHLIGNNVPNSGTASVYVPVGAMSTQARVKVKGVNNVFYDVSNQNFTILVGPNSLDDVTLNNYFKVYPNPAANLLYIDMLTVGKAYTIQIIDMLGRQVYERDLKSNTVINVSSFATGIYLVEIIDNVSGQKGVYKIIKQ